MPGPVEAMMAHAHQSPGILTKAVTEAVSTGTPKMTAASRPFIGRAHHGCASPESCSDGSLLPEGGS